MWNLKVLSKPLFKGQNTRYDKCRPGIKIIADEVTMRCRLLLGVGWVLEFTLSLWNNLLEFSNLLIKEP